MFTSFSIFFFFFNDTATTEIYTLSLHDALPIPQRLQPGLLLRHRAGRLGPGGRQAARGPAVGGRLGDDAGRAARTTYSHRLLLISARRRRQQASSRPRTVSASS